MSTVPHRHLALTLVVGAAVLGPGAAGASAAPGLPDRDADPVVLTGARLPGLVGATPREVVGFRRSGGAWRQVPVQVDERALVDFRAVRQSGRTPFSQLAYTDAGTFAGADPRRAFDADDELAAMARDAGDAAGGAADPRGVRRGSRTVVTLTDPLRPGARRRLYLFRAARPLDPGAGRRYVRYDFRLLFGEPKATYDYDGIADDGRGAPANPEASTVRTPFYAQRILSRWVADALRVTAGDATGVDVLDGDKVQVNAGCGRSELTFSRGGGGFIANRSGPVRAIRSYIGANSGTWTQRDHVYYDRADVTRTVLRVHPGISKVSQFYDYSPAAIGMTYRNARNPAGVRVDGEPDALAGGLSRWEQVTGPQGSVTTVARVATDVPGFVATTSYLDDATSPPVQQCGGYADQAAIGASGPLFTSSGANTDPTLGRAFGLTGTRTTFYGPPGQGAKVAALRSRQVDAPLRVAVG